MEPQRNRLNLKLFVGELSMPKREAHEEFDELCALAATGQLSPDEERRLGEHLDGCESCRAACGDYTAILRELPASERGVLDKDILRKIDPIEFREQFLARARAEGRRFSVEAERAPANKLWGLARLLPAYQGIAAGALVVFLLGVIGYRALHGTPKTDTGKITNAAVVSNPAVKPTDEPLARVSELESANNALQKTIAELKAQNAMLAGRLETSEKEHEADQAEKQDLERTLSRVNDMNGQLAAQMEQNNQVLAETKDELAKARSDRAAMETEVTAARNDGDKLSEQVRLQQASLDQERQLLYAGRDITDLMGARNLHIIDVHDADGSGKDRRSFGRVFYTEGKSLIFYAFDLDDKKVVNAKYTFAAWGERLGQPTSVKSLGVLYVDDKDQRRWVVKVDDPRELATIDSVFVTLEPHDGPSEKPRGHKILYAFLSGEANHP
jgi:hypothetical protein